MQAYEHGFRGADTRMVLRPDSEFFRYFVSPSGKMPDAQAQAPSAPAAAPASSAPATPR